MCQLARSLRRWLVPRSCSRLGWSPLCAVAVCRPTLPAATGRPRRWSACWSSCSTTPRPTYWPGGRLRSDGGSSSQPHTGGTGQGSTQGEPGSFPPWYQPSTIFFLVFFSLNYVIDIFNMCSKYFCYVIVVASLSLVIALLRAEA